MYRSVWVDVDMDDFETDDLVEELEGRGYKVTQEGSSAFPPSEYEMKLQLERIWQLRREGKSFDAELDKYLYDMLGKVV